MIASALVGILYTTDRCAWTSERAVG